MTKQKKDYHSVIAATLHVSEAEVAHVYPDYEYNWNEEQVDKLKGILFDLGLDTKQYYELQDVQQHRCRLGKIVTCRRWYGNERLDDLWLKSGLASTAAKDKAKNSRLCDDLYRAKAMTIDTQMALEARDKYNVVSDEEGEE